MAWNGSEIRPLHVLARRVSFIEKELDLGGFDTEAGCRGIDNVKELRKGEGIDCVILKVQRD